MRKRCRKKDKNERKKERKKSVWYCGRKSDYVCVREGDREVKDVRKKGRKKERN